MVEYSDLVQFFVTKLKTPSEIKPPLPNLRLNCYVGASRATSFLTMVSLELSWGGVGPVCRSGNVCPGFFFVRFQHDVVHMGEFLTFQIGTFFF